MEAPLDPITMAAILRSLPTIKGQQRAAAKSRKQEEFFQNLMTTPGRGNYVPTQQGGFFPTVGQFVKDYGQIGNQLTGALGMGVMGRRADRQEAEAETTANEQIMRTIEQIGQTRAGKAPEGSPTESALRGYLGLIGGPDAADVIPSAPRVHSTVKLANGNLGVVMSNSPTPQDTGMPYDYGIKTMVGEGGQVFGVGTSGAGRGIASGVTFGAPGAAPTPAPTPTVAPGGGVPGPGMLAQPPLPAPDTAGVIPANVNLDMLSPEQNQQLSQIISSMPSEQADAIIQMIAGRPPAAGAPVVQAPAAPAPGGAFRVPTKYQEALDTERAKISAGLEYSPQLAAAEAQKKSAVLDAETAAKIRADLPKVQSTLSAAITTANQLLAHPGLGQITGPLGGRIPDGPTAVKYFNAVMAGTPAADAMALHQQAKGQVFLRAYETLKGGGQITEVEGEAARQALGRIDRAQTTEAYKAAVAEFIQAAQAGFAKMQAAANQGGLAPAAPVAPAAPTQQRSIQDIINQYRKR